jgi:hypothetical protein
MSEDDFFDRIAGRLSSLRERGRDVMRRADEVQQEVEAGRRELEASANAATRWTRERLGDRS